MSNQAICKHAASRSDANPHETALSRPTRLDLRKCPVCEFERGMLIGVFVGAFGTVAVFMAMCAVFGFPR